MQRMKPWCGPSLTWKCVCKNCLFFTHYSPSKSLDMSVKCVGRCDKHDSLIFAYKIPPCVKWEYEGSYKEVIE